jgi:Fibronectin type III domain
LINISWERPLEINGQSLTYQVWYNNKMVHIDNNETMADLYNYTINHLEPYKNYTITIVACTRNCSEPSSSLLLRTKIGAPGPMNQPVLDTFNNGSIKLSWKPPAYLGGRLDFYLLNISSINNDASNNSLFKISGEKSFIIVNNINCYKHEIYFRIRAVNIDSIVESEFQENEKVYYGDFSPPIVYYCQPFYADIISSISKSSVAMIMTIFFVLCVLTIFAYLILRLYKKILEMKDIHTILPEGFDPRVPFKLNDGATKNVDLLRNHKLSNFEDNYQEVVLNENQICLTLADRTKVIQEIKKESNLNETSLKTKKSSDQNLKSSLAKSSVETNVNSVKDGNVDSNTGYTKMYKPKVTLEKSSAVDGYLDMSGKALIRKAIKNDYISNQLKSLIESSQNNDGYIDRKSIRQSFPANANGYVGFYKSS